MIALIELGARELLLAALLVLGNAAVSLAFQLGLGRRLLLATLRAALQLALLGLVLELVFDLDRPGPVVVVMVLMALLAGVEAVRSARHRVRGLWRASLAVMVTTAMVVTLYATAFVLRVEPWYAPRYVIPILGMVLGNCMNGIALGLESVLAGFRADRDRVECMLAHGATRAEAAREVVRRAVRTGLIPVINMMVAAGAISIPGMMTGQILAGESPLSAARYQLFILLAIAGGTALGTVAIVLASTRLVFDDRDRLRIDRIRALGE